MKKIAFIGAGSFGFTRNLVMRLINDGDVDNNNLHISISKGGK
jgi:alpha-galactosidase/6-phospho-beta-glucosidase family protein